MTRFIKTYDERNRILTYALTEDVLCGHICYGIKVEEANGEKCEVRGITTSKEEAERLLYQMADGEVRPYNAREIAQDYVTLKSLL